MLGGEAQSKKSTKDFFDKLSRCHKTGCAVLLITHSIQQARRMARQVAFLHQGKLIEQGETDLVLSKPSRAETKQFLDFYGI